MHPEEEVRTHADRILAMEEIQWLAGRLWRAVDLKTAAIDEAHLHIVNAAGEIIDFLYVDADFMGIDEESLERELLTHRGSSPYWGLRDKAVAAPISRGDSACAQAREE